MLNVICLACDSEWYNTWFFFLMGVESFIIFISVVEWVCLFSIGFQLSFPPIQLPPFIIVWVLFQSTNGSLLPYWWLFSRLIRVKVLHACVVFLFDVDLHLFHPYQQDYMFSFCIALSCSVGYQCAVNIFQSPSVFYISKHVCFDCSWFSVFSFQFLLSFSIRNSIFACTKFLTFQNFPFYLHNGDLNKKKDFIKKN